MKTADLIPFILLELNESDKYGFELTKNIKTKSEGKIVIKQPTLYTLLKKLEKSKFITSYWQDSEIGGKRHYYKLTENGKLQISTMPSYSILLANALKEDGEDAESENSYITTSTTPTETILPSSEIFSDNKLDNSTELDINISNSQILKSDLITENELFATSKEVVKFTEKIQTQNPTIEPQAQDNSQDFLNVTFTPENDSDIKFIDYEDFSKSKNYTYAKRVSSKLIYKSLLTSSSLIVLILICGGFASFCGTSVFYYLTLFASVLTAIFYPVLTIFNHNKIRKKYRSNIYKLEMDKKLVLRLCIFLLILIICTTVSVCVGQNTITKMLNYHNFANLYAPSIMSLAMFADLIIDYLLFSKIK